MSDELAKRAADAAARMKEREQNPFLTLPGPEWIDPVCYFAMTKARLVGSPLSLCMNLKYWASKGLTLDDAKRCFRRICDPDVSARLKFPTDLDAELAALAGQAIRDRRRREDTERLIHPTPVDRQVRSLAESFTMPREGR